MHLSAEIEEGAAENKLGSYNCSRRTNRRNTAYRLLSLIAVKSKTGAEKLS